MQKRHERVKRPWFLWWMFPEIEVATGPFWDRYERYFQTNFPIRWKIQREYPRKFRRFLYKSGLSNIFAWGKHYIKTIKWWFLHRTIHRFHVIRTGLKPDYYDIHTRMLHGCFTLLLEHAEGETHAKGLAALEKFSDWAAETNEEMYVEEHALLYWWLVERPARLNPWRMDDIPDLIAQNTKEFYSDQDDVMLLRLIDFRKKLF